MNARIIYFLVLMIFISCSNEKSNHSAGSHSDSTHQHSTAEETYTCPMHPKVLQDKPGKCPVCGMDLVLVNKATETNNDLMLTDSQIKLANITTERIGRRSLGESVILNGLIKTDEQKTEVISSRVAGRIEKLFVKETGQQIKRGQLLYTLYSEELLTLQQEYLLAKEQYETLGKSEKRYKSFLEAASRKLLLYGLTEAQIRQLSKQNIDARTTFVSTSSGIISEINTSEGQYVSEGASLYKIDDLSTVWVEAELYPNEVSLVDVGSKISVKVSGVDKMMEAKVSFLSPEFRSNAQVLVMRASIQNPENILKPGQFAQVYLTHSSREALALPVDAVIRDGQGTHVYIQSGINTFRPQMVKTGIESFDHVEITEGLKEGDTVAVTGAYLLYSEIILKKGADPMAGHTH